MARAKTSKKQATTGLIGQTDPRAPLEGAAFLKAAQPVLKLLGEDLLSRVRGSASVTQVLKARHEAERAARRTAEDFPGWQRQFVEQVAAAWLLSCVFVRTLEDRGLLGHARIAGVGAVDAQRLFFEMSPNLTEREYLWTVFRELSRLPAARDLFDTKHNPVWLLGPSADGAKVLLSLFRQPSADAPSFRFGQEDTRFLGDLYQDLNEEVQKRFALLQTPRFVESFILDRTLTPAIERFGLDEATLIDPTCGSGHFLLGAFERLFDARLLKEPGLGERAAAKKALEAVAGADINPYAVAIAKFRLTLAFLEKAGFKKLKGAPELPIKVVVADSLLHKVGAGQLGFGEREGQTVAAWNGEEFALEDEAAAKVVLGRRYAAVVGNPPYITVKDPVLRERYREMYESASGKYSLSAPFAERFFELAKEGGFVGQITANSFMKREFGKRLIEQCLPRINLNLIVNTSGAYIPGHGTPTVLLFGTNEPPIGTDLLAVLANRGEPTTPERAEDGLVWRSIAEHWSEVGFENDYINVARIDRKAIEKHPWSLGGGGAAELKDSLEERAVARLGDLGVLGVGGMSNADDVYIGGADSWARVGMPRDLVRVLVIGEELRDWCHSPTQSVFFPYDDNLELVEPSGRTLEILWQYRSSLWARAVFGGGTYRTFGRPWWEWHQVTKDRYRTKLSIVFAFVATHNHFVLDRGGNAFKQSAPIIKLSTKATEADHLALVAYLNSSTACFWMKQVSMNKGGSGIGRGVQDEAWEARFEFDSTKLGAIVLPSGLQGLWRYAQTMESMVDSYQAAMPRAVLASWTAASALSLPQTLEDSANLAKLSLARMCAVQEELDWTIYDLFGLLSKDEKNQLDRARAEALPDFPRTIDTRPNVVHRQGLHPGHRPFEVVLARNVLASGSKTAWFERNGYASPSEIRDTYAPSYQRLIEVRVSIIDQNPNIALLEQPEYKRRWTFRDYKAETVEAARAFVLDALESSMRDATEVLRGDQLATVALRDPKTRAVTELLPGDSKKTLRELIEEEAVPFLAAYRYTATGLEKREAWEKTWDLQRKEDAGEKVGDIPVPPKYGREDYREGRYFNLRGKLDVPKERFIAYHGCESDEDKEPVYGWAGWNHLQQAQALAALYQRRRTEEAWNKERLAPMLAGLLELVPWVRQWHNEPSDEFGGLRLGEYFETFLDAQCRELGLTREELRAWRPEAKKRGRGPAKKA